jgi:fibronectin-binding autotransporter adhesin
MKPKYRSLLRVLSTFTLTLAGVHGQTDGTWSVNASGNWFDAGNWNGGTVAGGVGAVANFTTVDITADQVVTVGGPVTLGRLRLADGGTLSNFWTFDGAGPLTLDNGAAQPILEANNRTHLLSLPLAGSNGLSKVGGGAVTLSGNNSGLSGALNLVDVTGTNGAGLIIDGTAALGGISSISVGGSSSSGQFLQLRNGVAVGSGVAISLNSAGGNSAPAGGIRADGAGSVSTLAGPINVTLNNARISNNGARRLDISGPISGGANGVIFRFAANEGILVTNEANAWTGVTTHSEGTLTFLPQSALPAASPLIIGASSPGTVQTNGSFTRSLGTGSGQVRFGGAEATVNNRALGLSAKGGDLAVNIGGAGATLLFNNFTTNNTGTPGTINTNILVLNGVHADGKLTWVNPLDLNGANRTIQVDANVAELQGGIIGSTQLNKQGAGMLVLSTANSWTGNFAMAGGGNVNRGILRLAHSEALGPVTAEKNITLSGSDRSVTVVELTGGISIDENKTMRTSGKSYYAAGATPIGDQVGLRNFSGNNAWNGSYIIAETGGAYGIESLGGTTLTMGSDPATARLIRNEANTDTRTLSIFGGGDVVMNLKLAGNDTRLLGINKVGSGKLTIPRADNDFTAVPNLRSGVIEIVSLGDGGSPSSLGTASSFNLGATLKYVGLGDSSNRSLGLLQTGATIDSSGSGALQLRGSGFSHQAGTTGAAAAAFVAGQSVLKVTDPSGIAVGQSVTGTGLADGTTITAIDVDSRELTLSAPTTATSTGGVALTIANANNINRTLTLTGTNTGDNQVAANLSNPAGFGVLGVTKTGSGTWRLSGNKNYTGPTSVEAGKLVIQNAFPNASQLSVAPTATLAISDVVLAANPTTGLALDIAGTLELAGPVTVSLAQASPTAGSYPVLKAGAIVGDPTSLLFNYRGSSATVTGTTVNLTIGNALSLKWVGEDLNAPGTWDVKGATNWVAGATPQTFHFGDHLLFDDTSFEQLVQMNGELRPGSVTVNTDFSYSFSGTGTLAGPFKLTKRGEGDMQLSGSHSFSGGILVEKGLLRQGGNQSLGANGQVITVQSGAALDFSGTHTANRDYRAVIAGTGIGGTGAVLNSGGGQNQGLGSLELAANASIGGLGRWDIRPIVAGTAEVDLKGFTLTKVGNNDIALVDGFMTSSGNVRVTEGTLRMTRMVVGGEGEIRITDGARLMFENYTTGSFAKNVVLDDSIIRLQGSNMTMAADMTLIGNSEFDIEAARTLTLANGAKGSGPLIKGGAGLLTLAAPSTYLGGTTIAAGTLIVGTQTTAGSLPAGAVENLGTLVINRGDTAYEVGNVISGTGSVTIGQNAGGSFDSLVTLTGTNSFAGNVAVNSGGLKIRKASALGEGLKSITLTNGTAGRPQLYLDGSAGNIVLPVDFSFFTSSANQTHPAIGNLAGDNAINGNITLTSGGGDTAIVVQGGSLVLSGEISANVADRRLNLGGVAGTQGFVNGVISNGTHPVGLQKYGANTWTLFAANAYTGPTTVFEGTLRVNGNQSAATGSVTVDSGATLGGIGTIGGTVLAVTGSRLAPGEGIGTLTATGVLLQGELEIEVDGISDQLVVNSLNISGGSLKVSPLGAGATRPVHVIASYGVLTGTFSSVSGLPAGYAVDYNYNGENKIALVSGSTSPFDSWMAGFPSITDPALRLPGADPDGDGVSNLAEFAFNGNPTGGASRGFVNGLRQNVPGVGDALVLTFAARAGANFNGTATSVVDGVTYTVQGTQDLSNFNATVTEVVPALVPGGWPAAGNGYQYHSFRLNVPTATPKGFLRVQVQGGN